ncbi:MAG: hypothetical protein H7318_16570 [Oligoflexus sp.]|nr:hypothetical protein [Oligoflexus sp.]
MERIGILWLGMKCNFTVDRFNLVIRSSHLNLRSFALPLPCDLAIGVIVIIAPKALPLNIFLSFAVQSWASKKYPRLRIHLQVSTERTEGNETTAGDDHDHANG